MASNYNFSSLGFDDNSSTMLQDAHQACTRAGAWPWLETFNEGSFMFSNHPLISTITEKMEYKGHSGASFGWTMRNMECIAKEGWDTYATRCRNNRKATPARQAAPATTDSTASDPV